MNHGEFTNHLINEECYPDDDWSTEYSQLWRNAINGEICYVPTDDDLTLFTWGHVVYELKIAPPHNADSDYYVYVGWRENQYKERMNAKK